MVMAVTTKTKKRGAEGLDLTVDEDVLASWGDAPVPGHVAVIMDGNGRWATARGLPRLRGHHEGANAVRRVVESCRYLGVDVLTLYAFSAQNWERPRGEISGLMTLFDIYIKKERNRLLQNGIRLRVIGERGQLKPKLLKAIEALEEVSADNDGMLLQVAVSYGGREEILRATRRIAADARDGAVDPETIDEALFARYLYTEGAPDPDLLIRSSGELRVSNFLLWQIAYAEIFVTDTLWPDFDEAHLLEAFRSYRQRQRRFGKTGAQLGSDEEDA